MEPYRQLAISYSELDEDVVLYGTLFYLLCDLMAICSIHVFFLTILHGEKSRRMNPSLLTVSIAGSGVAGARGVWRGTGMEWKPLWRPVPYLRTLLNSVLVVCVK